MPYSIIFDTNYLRSLSCEEYEAGMLPAKLSVQLEGAAHQGHTVVVVETVRMEFNAHLAKIARDADENLLLPNTAACPDFRPLPYLYVP